jgi:nitroimidazol reductase NimA-like FMN-containing flavoprotein (pyridoxamine 5'-phosphate oxidase superfamily)
VGGTEELIMPTFGGRVSPGERTRRLTPHECKAWLCSHHEGRLGYRSGKGPRSVVVSYAVAEDKIVLRLPDYNDIVHYAPGSEVSLDVDGGTPAAHRETVVVTGRAAIAENDQEPLIDQTALLEQWPPDVSTQVICVPLTAVEGFELRDP